MDNKVIMVYPDSSADLGGISVGDEIVIINGIKVNDDLSQWLEYFRGEQISMGAFDAHGTAKRILVNLSEEFYFSRNVVSFVDSLSEEKQDNVKRWRGY